MLAVILIGLCVGLTSGFRGPHHPKSSISHHHYSPQKDVKLTQDAELLHDATHLKEDIGPMAEQLDFSQMTKQEIEFHYFNIHDVDNNAMMDGLELLHALQHTLHGTKLPEEEHDNVSEDALNIEADEGWIIELVDQTLEADDLNNDGYLDYTEFVLGRKRDHIAQAKRDTSAGKLRTNEDDVFLK